MGKRKKSEMELRNCFNCEHCTYIGEGDHICDMTNDVVVEDWMPADDFYACNGKDFKCL